MLQRRLRRTIGGLQTAEGAQGVMETWVVLWLQTRTATAVDRRWRARGSPNVQPRFLCRPWLSSSSSIWPNPRRPLAGLKLLRLRPRQKLPAPRGFLLLHSPTASLLRAHRRRTPSPRGTALTLGLVQTKGSRRFLSRNRRRNVGPPVHRVQRPEPTKVRRNQELLSCRPFPPLRGLVLSQRFQKTQRRCCPATAPSAPCPLAPRLSSLCGLICRPLVTKPQLLRTLC